MTIDQENAPGSPAAPGMPSSPADRGPVTSLPNSVAAGSDASLFVVEAWNQARPYVVVALKDFVISATLWCLLWLFKLLMSLAPIDGWPGVFIKHIHASGTVLAIGLFVGLLVIDVIAIHRRHAGSTK